MNRPLTRQIRSDSELSGSAISGDRTPGIAYWMFNFEPRWEAASKELEALAASFRPVYGTRTISLNLNGQVLSFAGGDRHIPVTLAPALLPMLMRAARAAPVNHILASPAERLLTPLLARLDNTILTITKGSPSLRRIERNIEALLALRYIVVESERHRELLLQLGVLEERIRMIYPGLDPEPYRPATGPLSILFATSPKKHDLLTRGIYLMLKVAELLPDVRFRLVWRWNPQRIHTLIRKRRLRNVEVFAGYVRDMKAMYDSAHAVILPALEPDSFKPCPHSGLHSLAHGKPLLVSQAVSIAGIVDRHRCGVVFEPTVESLRAAIERLAAHYDEYQANALPTLAREFSRRRFIERYSRLYTTMLGGGAQEPVHATR